MCSREWYVNVRSHKVCVDASCTVLPATQASDALLDSRTVAREMKWNLQRSS